MYPNSRFWSKFWIFSLVLLFFGCGNWGGDSGPTVRTGYFLDGYVEGIESSTPTRSGITGIMGGFTYQVGEIVQFSVGSIIIGQAQGKYMLTPLDLVPSATDVTNPTVTNIARLLQSLDWDGIVTNGITITEAMREEAQGRSINFAQSITDFENDPDVQNFFDTLNQRGLFGTSGVRILVDATQAQDHLSSTIGKAAFHGVYWGEYFGDDTGIWSFGVDLSGDVIGRLYNDTKTVWHAGLKGRVESDGRLILRVSHYLGVAPSMGGDYWNGTIDSEGNVQGTWYNGSKSGTFIGDFSHY